MREVILAFVWKHLKKILSGLVMAMGYGMWSFIQMPYQAAADIEQLRQTQEKLHKEMQEAHISAGANGLLLQRIDVKLDKLQESVIKLEVQRRTPAFR